MIKSGFSLNSAENEIGFQFPPGRAQHLFWTLPPVFTGNKVRVTVFLKCFLKDFFVILFLLLKKVASYGGHLTLTQRFETTYASRPSTDKDVILIGNGVTLFWNNPEQLSSNATQVGRLDDSIITAHGDLFVFYKVNLKNFTGRFDSAEGKRLEKTREFRFQTSIQIGFDVRFI